MPPDARREERPAAPAARPRKRSVTIAGHATSLSLEDEFWTELKRIARARRTPLSALLTQIDAERGPRPLSSAVRVFILRALRDQS